MKKHICLIAVAAGLLSADLLPSFAAPIGNTMAGRNYLIAARDLSPWSTGIYMRSGKRVATVDGIADESIEYSRFLGYVAYDFFPWMTPYIVGGSGHTSLDGTGADEYKPEFGFGVRFNALQHDLLDPDLLEDTILINASCQYTVSEAFRNDSGQDMQEFYASLTLSIVNETYGNKMYWPHAISIFVGPAYSVINTSSVNTKDDFGFILGLEVYYTKRISFYLSGEMMGKNSNAVMGGLHVGL